MLQKLNTKIVPFSRIQVSPSRLRRKNVAALRGAMQVIRKYGQPRPLIIGAAVGKRQRLAVQRRRPCRLAEVAAEAAHASPSPPAAPGRRQPLWP